MMPSRRCAGRALARASCALALVLTDSAAVAFELVTAAEAQLPAGAQSTKRGITRGPAIELVSPSADGRPVHSPFDLQLAFVPRGSARIALDSVRLVYAREPPVDLSERIRPAVTDQGVVLRGARVPAGRHRFVVTVADHEGRTTTRAFELQVAE